MPNWEPDEQLGQNLVDVRNEERRSSHYEVSPRERDDDAERDRHEFDDEDLSPMQQWMRATLAGRDEYGGP